MKKFIILFCIVFLSGCFLKNEQIHTLLNQQVLPAIAQSFLQWQQQSGQVPTQARLEVGEEGIGVLFE